MYSSYQSTTLKFMLQQLTHASFFTTGWENGLFLGVDSFVMVNGRKACNMTKVSEFRVKSIKLVYQCI